MDTHSHLMPEVLLHSSSSVNSNRYKDTGCILTIFRLHS